MQQPSIERIEAEVRQEKAECLGRVGERLEQTLAEIRAIGEHLLDLARRLRCHGADGVPPVPVEIRESLARQAALCEVARGLRYQLIVQREAMGFRRHEDLDRHYPMPAPLAVSDLVGVEVRE